MVRREGAFLPIERTPPSYDVTYRVEETAGDEPVRSRVRLRVRRPFESRVDVVSANGEDTGPSSIRFSRLGRLGTAAAGHRNDFTVFAVPPAVATGDLRLDPALGAAVEAGLVDVRERRRVLGRECQVYRAGATVGGGTLTPWEPGSSDHADFCVDAAGFVLEEVWSVGGRPVQRRLAVAVEEEAAFDDSVFHPGRETELSVDDGGGSIRRLAPESRPADRSWAPARVPDGFVHTGRFEVVSVRPRPAQDATSDEPPPTTRSVVDVWTRGADLLAVDSGTLVGGGGLPSSPANRAVDLGQLGEGRLVLDFRSTEVRSERDGAFVKVYGTLPPDELVEVARSLRQVESTDAVYVESDF